MKYISLLLIILGIAMLSLGLLIQFGFLEIQLVDTESPKIIYNFPFDGWTGSSTDFTEIVAYVKDNAEGISTAVYYDEKRPSGLKLQRVIKPRRYSIWIPDVTFDGAVDKSDVNLVSSLFGVTYEKNRELYEKYSYCDVYPIGNPDYKIDSKDYSLVSRNCYTYTFAIDNNVLFESKTYQFSIVALDNCGNSNSISGSFTITSGSTTMLSGKWYMNNMLLVDNAHVEVNTNTVTFKFVSNMSGIIVRAVINGVTYTFEKSDTNIWTKTLTLKGENVVILTAKTQDNTYTNSITVTVSAPEFEINYKAIIFMATGTLLIVAGIVVEKKSEGAMLY